MQDKIEIAKLVAEKISSLDGIQTAYVDDYNSYGCFQVVAVLDLDKDNKPAKQNFSLRKINKEVKKILKETSGVSRFGSEVDSPRRTYNTYTYRNVTDSIFTGYERSYTMVDFVITLPKEQVSVAELLT